MHLIPYQTFVRVTFGAFVPWYFVEMPVAIVNAYGAYARAFWEIFSFPFLLRTLLSPWKNMVDPYPKNHLDFYNMFGALIMNVMSRVIGCMFRIVMMVIGVAVHIACLALFLAWLTIWMTFPLLLILGSAFLLHTLYT